jgi:hypothetical protein
VRRVVRCVFCVLAELVWRGGGVELVWRCWGGVVWVVVFVLYFCCCSSDRQGAECEVLKVGEAVVCAMQGVKGGVSVSRG